MAFCVQGDKKNEWWFPTPNQKKVILPIYKKWLKELGQGNMMYPGTEVTATASFDGFTYSIFMAGPGSYIQNISHKDKRKRMIHFLPEHNGSTISS
ncbi:hypothetical protein OAK19_06045 [Aureispira]|nr:hypothetical protein [Aureispira sp.]